MGEYKTYILEAKFSLSLTEEEFKNFQEVGAGIQDFRAKSFVYDKSGLYRTELCGALLREPGDEDRYLH